ncbi:MAG TPA: aromatic ring-hydroxylating dioxygenase subunit alpha [Acidimicrobiia bacterium]|nr:aromatic ring-hydroxylating dioxygenase subunit alpha [Acidimicrobiia bacterium]HIL06730.1 aromatic ring-hydroxylating dioxygenase subunit alpha [Acidimicrobiia bacterium]
MLNSTARPIIETLLQKASAKEPWRTEHLKVEADTYCNTKYLETEHRRLFNSLPQAIALSADLPNAGDTLTRECGGLDVLLTRDSTGGANAFLNVCKHRSAQVMPEERSCSMRLVCPYHAWSYDLEGSLVGIPDKESFPEIELPQNGLRRLPIHEGDGLIWVTPSINDEATCTPSLGSLLDDFTSFDLDGYEHWRTHHFELEMNWKLVIDTFLEPYHFASLHRDTVGPIFISNLCHVERSGPHIREVLPRKSLLDLAEIDPNQWDLVPHSALVYVLFPATVFVMQVDHVETWRITPHPTDPSQSVCDLDFYIPQGSISGADQQYWEKNWKLTVDTVVNEDFIAMTGVQRGLSSGAFPSINVGANEPALGMFHSILKEHMTPISEVSSNSHL